MDAVAPIFAAHAQAQQYVNQAAQAQQQAKDVAIQATEVSEQRREQLNASLSNIQNNRAGADVGLDSPTAVAIRDAVTATSERGQAMSRLGSLNQIGSLNNQASGYKSAAKNSIIGGYISGFTAIGQDAAKAAGA